jgi:hypothetical protein
MPGYFKVERDFLDSDFWLSEPFTKPQAWVDLFGIANHAPGFFTKRGIDIPLKRSQTGRSELTLAKRWQWSRNKVRRFLKRLEKEDKITLKQDNKTSIITICNYEVYQGNKNSSETPNDTPNDTPERHQKDTKRNTNKNVENVKKNENKNKTSKVFGDDSVEMKLSKYLYKVLLKSDQDLKEPNLQNWSKDFDNLIRVQGKKPADIQTVINYAHDPANSSDKFSWIPSLRSPKKVKEHFTTIFLQAKPINSGQATDNGSKKAEEAIKETKRLLDED